MNRLFCGDSSVVMEKKLDDNIVDLTVTSPPYDNLREYNGFKFDYKTMLQQLYRVTKPGGVVVWVVHDATIKKSETGTSFRQALYAMNIGFLLHDTMFYEKNSVGFPARRTSNRYTNNIEYMFVFSKDGPPKTAKLICDKENIWAGVSPYSRPGNPTPQFSPRNHIWKYTTSFNEYTGKHPAVFPEELARDHILTWSTEGDLVLDPMCGSGTTIYMANELNRDYVGIDCSQEYLDITKENLTQHRQDMRVKARVRREKDSRTIEERVHKHRQMKGNCNIDELEDGKKINKLDLENL